MSAIFHIFILAFVLKMIFESTNPVICFFTGVLGIYVAIKLALWFFDSVSVLFWIFLFGFSLTWSLELYQQTVARLWRQGQTSRTVVVQHIVTKDTIDERILKALEQKDMTQSALIEAVKADLPVVRYKLTCRNYL